MVRLLKPFILIACLAAGLFSSAKSTNRNFASASAHTAFLLKSSAAVLYDSLHLSGAGMNKNAFKYAWAGYRNLLEKGKIRNTSVISICDFTQSSAKKRLYIIDLDNMRLSMNTYVAHGRKSGGEFAKSFSNYPNSHKSSLGFYITGDTYVGSHGLSLRINGIERGINDRALKRNIVVHGADYTGEDFMVNNSFCGRSYGCPAVPATDIETVINTIKDGTCLFIYYPNQQYLKRSKILNG